jgi:phosphoglycerol transferase MdoB-like AlkP superfamily enzyme
MLRKILFLLVYLFSWVIFFEIARVFFLISTSAYAKEVSASLKFQSLWYGLKMDLSMAAYLTILVCLFVLAAVFIPFFKKKTVYFIYTGIILFLLVFITLADAESFKAWGTRLDYTPVKFLSTPKEAFASIGHLPIVWMILGFLLVYLLLFWFFRKVVSRSTVLLSNNKFKLVQLLLVLCFTIALIIPIRGGFQLAPINQSHVFFSNNQYANNAAINGTWNFMQSLTKAKYLSKNIYQYMDEAEADSIVNSLFKTEGKKEQVINDSIVKPNVVIIIWESFTEKALNKIIDGKPVIKYFRELTNEGIYFSNCYSTGDRTDKGISAVLSGYPALSKESIINYNEKASRLTGLGNIFFKQGYNTSFYYGGESEFMNIKGYVTAQQFQEIINKDDFD